MAKVTCVPPPEPEVPEDLTEEMWKKEMLRAYKDNLNCSGIWLLCASDIHAQDAIRILSTAPALNYNILPTYVKYDPKTPPNTKYLAYFKAMTYPQAENHKDLIEHYGNSSKFHYTVSYFCGYGGCDSNGHVYILLNDGNPDIDKVYIEWIVSALKDRHSNENKNHFCILLFELYHHQSSSNATPCLPRADNFIIAMSGLRNETPTGNAVSEWTDKLCNALVNCNIPLTDILDKIEKELADQSPQHVSGADILFLNEELARSKTVEDKTVIGKTDLVHMQMNKNQTNGVVLVVTSPDFRKDKNIVVGAFRQFEGYTVIVDDESPVDYKNVLALIKAVAYYHGYGDSNKVFGFYYSGYGGSDNGRAYIQLGNTDLPEERIYLDWIVSLYGQSKKRFLPCLMFFELCSKSASDSELLLLPNRSMSLVAASGLHTAGAGRTGGCRIGGRHTGVGKWTQKLFKCIQENDGPITSLIDKAHNELHKLDKLVGCSYVCSVYLEKRQSNFTEEQSHHHIHKHRARFKQVEEEKEKTPSTPPSPPPSTPPSTPPDIDIKSIMDRFPEKNDLEAALKDMKDDVELWQNQFGKRLIKRRMIESETSLRSCLTLEFLIDYIYSKKCQPTWDEVINALEDPYNIEVVVNRHEKIVVADSVRKYLCNKSVFLKYKKQKK